MQKTTQKLFLDLQTNGVGSEVVGSKIESGNRPLEDPKSRDGSLSLMVTPSPFKAIFTPSRAFLVMNSNPIY